MFENPFEYDNESTSTVFRDIIFLALAGFVVVLILIISFINPPTKIADQDIPPPGNMMVELFWDDQYDLDIDLWVQGPSDIAVGYPSKSGKLFDLLRDDLGFYRDKSDRNYEISMSRGLVSGEYTINVMFFSNKHIHHFNSSGLGSPQNNKRAIIKGTPPTMPIKVEIVVSIKKDKNESMIKIIDTVVELKIEGEEKTAANFKLDEDYNLIHTSVNTIFNPLAVPPT